MIFQVYLTEQCNLNCSYCFEGEKGKQEMSAEIIPHIIDFIKQYMRNDFVVDETICVNFNGGEALLKPSLLREFTEKLKEAGVHSFSISTNFFLIDEDIIDFLAENNFFVQISIDGKKGTHDANRVDYNSNGSFDAVFSNLQLFMQKYPNYYNLVCSMVYTPETVKKLYEGIEFLVNNGIYRVYASYDATTAWTKENSLEFKQQVEKVGDLYRRIYDRGHELEISFLTHQIDNFMGGFGKRSCGACRDVVGILPNGDVFACGSFLNTEGYEEYKIGSIYDGIIPFKTEYFLHNLKIDEIQEADIIYCMKDGEIVESGTSAELRELNGLYEEMLKNQGIL